MGFPLSCAVRERERKIPQNDCEMCMVSAGLRRARGLDTRKIPQNECEMCMVSAGLRRARGLDTKTYFCVFKLKITFSY
jgi:hypothetical protein